MESDLAITEGKQLEFFDAIDPHDVETADPHELVFGEP
jgi:hypothetical protein